MKSKHNRWTPFQHDRWTPFHTYYSCSRIKASHWYIASSSRRCLCGSLKLSPLKPISVVVMHSRMMYSLELNLTCFTLRLCSALHMLHEKMLSMVQWRPQILEFFVSLLIWWCPKFLWYLWRDPPGEREAIEHVIMGFWCCTTKNTIRQKTISSWKFLQQQSPQ